MTEGFLKDRADEGHETAVAMGVFDGVHRGHREVLKAAAESGYEPWVFTFSETAFPERKKSNLRIEPAHVKYGIMESCGIKHCYAAEFDDVKSLSGEEFVRDILVKRLGCKFCCCGGDFRFGHFASCDVSDLVSLGEKYGIKVKIVGNVTENGKTISSTWIRSVAENGDMEMLSKLTGYPFCIEGKVVHGKKLGQKHGIPTVNLGFSDGYIIPKYGVYVSASYIDGKFYPSVTNIGTNPTVTEENIPLAETHVINFSEDLYDKSIMVFLIEYVREEKKFDSEDELFERIDKDRKKALDGSLKWINENGKTVEDLLGL